MAKHEVQIHENTGATQASAPYLGTYVTKVTTQLDDYAAEMSKDCGLPAIQVAAILSGAFAEFAALEKQSPTRINTDIGQLYVALTGSFETADAAFNAAKNSLDLSIKLDDLIKNELADTTPTIVTDQTITKVRVDSIADTEVERPQNVIYGMREFIVAGMNLVTTDEGASVFLMNNIGTTFPCTVTEVLSKQRIKVRSNTTCPGDDYKLVVKSRGGDAEGPLQTSFRKVKYIYVAPPTPHTLTKVSQEANPDNQIQFDTTMQVDVLGTNLNGFNASRGDTVKWELVENGVVTDTSDNTQDIVSTTATQIHFEGAGEEESALPFRGSLESAEEWYGKHGRVKVTINGVTKTVENIFYTNT